MVPADTRGRSGHTDTLTRPHTPNTPVVGVWVKPAVLIRERPAGRETKTPMQYTSVSSRSLLLGSQRHYPQSATSTCNESRTILG